jgi:hypothetical protein
LGLDSGQSEFNFLENEWVKSVGEDGGGIVASIGLLSCDIEQIGDIFLIVL